jgi:hypothetical protein
MRTLTVYQVRPPVDDWVDRPEVEVRQRMQLTGTNRPRTCLLSIYLEQNYFFFLHRVHCAVPDLRSGTTTNKSLARGVYLFTTK